MECFLDFCLACDKQTSDGLYCSQACRLADMERASSSSSDSSSSHGSDGKESWRRYQPADKSTFSLPQATDSNTGRSSTTSRSRTESAESARDKVLTPSTSRTSLSSAMSNISGHTGSSMSSTVQNQLQGYVSSFDAVRELKRRSLSVQSGIERSSTLS